MSHCSRHGKSHKVDLKLNLAPPVRGGISRRTATTDNGGHAHGSSSPNSCLSSETEQGLQCHNSPEASSMVLAACPRCLMYMMLSEEDPKCPRCKSAVLLDFLHGDSTTKRTGKT